MPSVPNGDISQRVRTLEIQMATVMSQQANQAEKLEEVREELRYLKRSVQAMVFTLLGGILVFVVQNALNGGFST